MAALTLYTPNVFEDGFSKLNISSAKIKLWKKTPQKKEYQ